MSLDASPFPADRELITTIMLSAAVLVQRLTSEGLIGMRAAAKIYGEAHEGKPPHPSTPTRHALHGVRLRSGRVVKLEVVRIAGRIMTSRQAVLRFFALQNEPVTPSDQPVVESPRQCTRRHAAASAKLDEVMG